MVFSSSPPVPRNGVAVRPISTIPSSDISFLRLSQLNPICRSTSEYDDASAWCASSTTMHDVSRARRSSWPGSLRRTLSSDCIVDTMTPFLSSRLSVDGRLPPWPQKRCRCRMVPLLPTVSKTLLKLLTACSHSSVLCATQTMNFESRCRSCSDGLPSLSHSMRVSTTIRVLPEPVGTAIRRRFTGLPPSRCVPSSMPRMSRPVVYW